MLRAYAGTNPGEFFAVATEAFFTLPLPLEAEKPALYDVLRRTTARIPPPGSVLSFTIGPIGPIRKDRTGAERSRRRGGWR